MAVRALVPSRCARVEATYAAGYPELEERADAEDLA